ncbi:MAG: hypothetical protein ACT4OJ_09345 [Bacteroidota bacterium]
MRKFLFLLPISLVILTSCGNNNDKSASKETKETKTQEDFLMDDVMDGHDVGMAKYGKLKAMQNNVQQLLDSIAKLPAKVRETIAPLNQKLNSLKQELSDAKQGMDKWMEEFNMDSAVNNTEKRIKYLLNEKMKVGKVKDAILNSLARADSLLKTKL